MEGLETVVERLERVAGRLERFEGHVGTAGSIIPSGASTPISSGSAAASTPSSPAPAVASSVEAYDLLLVQQVARVVVAAKRIGREGELWPIDHRDQVVESSKLFEQAFQELRRVVEAMSACKRPAIPELQKLLAPAGDLLVSASNKAEHCRSPANNHLKMIAEGLQALTWTAFTGSGEGSPVTHVESTLQSAEFYGNKALKIYRSKDVTHSEWIAAVKDAIKGMKSFVAKYHAAGPQWKADGITVQEFLTSGAPPLPPPVQEERPPVQKPGPTRAWQVDKEDKPDELTASLTDAKKGLKKPEEEATPAEPAAGAQGAPPAGNAIAAAAAAAAAALKKREPAAQQQPAAVKPAAAKPAAASKPQPAPPAARTQLVADRKWEVEHHKGNHEILIEDSNPKHALYIFKCEDCVVQVKGKLNAITMDNCKRTGLVFDSVLASVEVVNCSRSEVQCTGHIDTIAIDKCEGCQLYVPHTSMDVAVTVAQSSAINVVITGEEDCQEYPIPEQFVSKFVDGKLVTEPAQHTGAG